MMHVRTGNGLPTHSPHLGENHLYLDQETEQLGYSKEDGMHHRLHIGHFTSVPDVYRGAVIRVGVDIWQWLHRMPSTFDVLEDVATITLSGHPTVAFNQVYTLVGKTDASGVYLRYLSADGAYQINAFPGETYLDNAGDGLGDTGHDYWEQSLADWLGGVAGDGNGTTVSAHTTQTGLWRDLLGRYCCETWRRHAFKVNWLTNGATKNINSIVRLIGETTLGTVTDATNGSRNYLTANLKLAERALLSDEVLVRISNYSANTGNDLTPLQIATNQWQGETTIQQNVKVYMQTESANLNNHDTLIEFWLRRVYLPDEIV